MNFILSAEICENEKVSFRNEIKTNFTYLVSRAKELIQNTHVLSVEITDVHGESKLLIEK